MSEIRKSIQILTGEDNYYSWIRQINGVLAKEGVLHTFDPKYIHQTSNPEVSEATAAEDPENHVQINRVIFNNVKVQYYRFVGPLVHPSPKVFPGTYEANVKAIAIIRTHVHNDLHDVIADTNSAISAIEALQQQCGNMSITKREKLKREWNSMNQGAESVAQYNSNFQKKFMEMSALNRYCIKIENSTVYTKTK